MLYDLAKKEIVTVSEAAEDELSPATDGKRIVWRTPIDKKDFRPLSWSKLHDRWDWNNIYLYDIGSGKTRRILHNRYAVIGLHIEVQGFDIIVPLNLHLLKGA